jgi:hypothetical protein
MKDTLLVTMSEQVYGYDATLVEIRVGLNMWRDLIMLKRCELVTLHPHFNSHNGMENIHGLGIP